MKRFKVTSVGGHAFVAIFEDGSAEAYSDLGRPPSRGRAPVDDVLREARITREQLVEIEDHPEFAPRGLEDPQWRMFVYRYTPTRASELGQYAEVSGGWLVRMDGPVVFVPREK